jgi:hypothetical protein
MTQPRRRATPRACRRPLAARVNLGRILPVLGTRPVESIKPADLARLVSLLAEDGLARESIRKTIATLAMVFDYHNVQPNPARDRRTVWWPLRAR